MFFFPLLHNPCCLPYPPNFVFSFKKEIPNMGYAAYTVLVLIPSQ